MLQKMSKLFMTSQMKNWQTSLTGALGSILYVLTDAGVLNAIPEDKKGWIVVGTVFAISFLSKDSNKTGGSKPLTNEAKTRARSKVL